MGYISRNNNFKNLLVVCNVEAVSFDSELSVEIWLLLCNPLKFWQMINLKFSFNATSILSLLIAFALSVMLSGCYAVRVYHDTEMLREKHDGEISSVSMLFTDSQIGGPAKISSACPGGASLIEIEQTVSDGLVHYLSLGFYSPQTIRVWCKRRKR